VAVHAVGCGTPRGAPLPLRAADGSLEGYKKDREGRVVTSRADEALLESIALETGGRYHRATAGEAEIDEIASALSGLARGEFGAELRARYEERFFIPLLAGWIALFAETLLGDRRRAGAARRDGGEVA
jgi:Ca-activated chloride channel family protein